MNRSPLFYVGATLVVVFAYHRFVKPLPGAKQM